MLNNKKITQIVIVLVIGLRTFCLALFEDIAVSLCLLYLINLSWDQVEIADDLTHFGIPKIFPIYTLHYLHFLIFTNNPLFHPDFGTGLYDITTRKFQTTISDSEMIQRWPTAL